MIRQDLIFAKQGLATKDEVISFMVDVANRAGLLVDKAEFQKTVYAREAEISTAVGYGIAIPHGKTDAAREAFIGYVGLSKAFEWDEETKEQVDTVFLIGVPAAHKELLHLKAIAAISKSLMREEFRTRLKACTSSEAAYELLDEINREIKQD